MSQQDVSLNDRFDLSKSTVLLNGTQALVRLMLMQKARDEAAGLNTAGYCTGYRGSPLGAVDQQMTRAEKILAPRDIKFQPGTNEDLAATAIWGSQQAELRGEGRYDGVFALWYGKGPGVDRSGDVMRHANMAGTSPKGGVLMAMGDDHTGESSTVLHQSDWALVDAYMPIVSPAGVQEILDYGLYGWALSRFAGVWVGLKTMKDTIEATAVVDGRPDRMQIITPDFPMPEGGLNIRLQDTPVAQEARMIRHKRHAAEAFARANRIDKRVYGREGAKIGFVAAGKNWLDLSHALSLLGIDAAEAERLGITTYKVGQVWPLDMTSFREWAAGLDLVVVVEEKRKLLEVQIKEALFDEENHCRIYGGTRADFTREGARRELFTAAFALDPILIAEALGEILEEEGCGTEQILAARKRLGETRRADNATDIAARTPWFCSGCPHNSSTKVPEGSRAYAGIGCHYMSQWMDRETLGFTQMGGEGANWMGESLFSKREHVFQNLGDGTFNHSGVLAIRAAVAAGTRMTYKILFNDAVAMTGGQPNEGDLTAQQIAREIQAIGVSPIVVVYDPKEDVDLKSFPPGLEFATRDKLMDVQRRMATEPGTSAILYIQTCAAEKRRRRKRGEFPDPDKRVFINTDVCEGCGDCGVQSNCVSLVPVETELGRKRAVDQSSCNKDFSCVNGFCPSFVTLQGAKVKKAAARSFDLPDLPEPQLPAINGTWNIVITGVGGTGVVTIGAVLSMAAHIDGLGAGMMEMAGLAQKGGAVHIHCRLARDAGDITAVRVATGEADAVIGGDLVVTAGAKTLGLMTTGRSGAVVNSHEIVTGDFTRLPDFRLPADQLRVALEARLGAKLSFFDASEIARVMLGDSIFSNMMVFGAAWQQGLVPVSLQAIRRAIELNGAGVDANLRAFDLGRWAMAFPADARAALAPAAPSTPAQSDPVEFRATHLAAYQDEGLAQKYRAFLTRAEDPDLRLSIAKGYHKLLAYKDEYEVARLHLATMAKVREGFDGDLKPSFHLAPPILMGGKDSQGRPKKREFGPWILPVFRLLAGMKALRGGVFDLFGYTAERKMERNLIAQYERDMTEVLQNLTPNRLSLARELAELPLTIRGFGPVKEAAARRAALRREELLAQLRKGDSPKPQNRVSMAAR